MGKNEFQNENVQHSSLSFECTAVRFLYAHVTGTYVENKSCRIVKEINESIVKFLE